MPRVYHRKARKDYPQQGIKKGDMYYTADIKTGPRSGRTLRSLTPLKPSQLTVSEFKSGWLGAEESLEGNFSAEDLRSAAERIGEIGEQARDSYDNMPESLQYSQTGEMLEERSSRCEEVKGELEQIADSMEDIENQDVRERARDDFDGDEMEAQDNIDSELEEKRDEAREHLSDMPE